MGCAAPVQGHGYSLRKNLRTGLSSEFANSLSTLVPGHYNLRELADFVQGDLPRRGTAVEFGVISCCDGIANGHEGMKYIPACSVRWYAIRWRSRPKRTDWMPLVLLASCDKILPGMLMAAAPGGCINVLAMGPVPFGHGQHHGLCQ